MKKAILIRVGIDMTEESGEWNAPVNPLTNDFVYVPIQQIKIANVPGMERRYDKFMVPALDGFSKRNNCAVLLPQHLLNRRMHIDPDFENLTYGDTRTRGKQLLDFKEGDLVVFFASLRSVTKGNLVYALIGILTVREIVRVKDIPESRRDENAHTRNCPPEPTDVVVRGKGGKSGRFARCIPIGEHRKGAYRVQKPLLREWGGLSIKDGYIQRSANPPLFSDPKCFDGWLRKQKPRLIKTNNP